MLVVEQVNVRSSLLGRIPPGNAAAEEGPVSGISTPTKGIQKACRRHATVAFLGGTEGSNPSPSRDESVANSN
jgi:hypothetical protein